MILNTNCSRLKSNNVVQTTPWVNKVVTVTDVHHVHAWSLTNDINLMTLHVQINQVLHDTDVLKQIKQALEESFNVQHTTIQVEHLPCPDDDCI